MARIEEIVLHRLRIPLSVPYKVSLHVFHHFEPIVACLRDSDGRTGWGEAEITPGYSDETLEGGWAWCRALAAALVGRDAADAPTLIAPTIETNPHAASVLTGALDSAQGHPLLDRPAPAAVPLLAPVNAMDPAAAAAEVEHLIATGFRTLKVKVGFSVPDDLHRVAAIQRAAAGRATLRLDANQAFDRAAGCTFAAALEPAGIELFEQPCDKADWAANAAVAAVSTVPLMLDESIYGLADIDRAAAIAGVGFVKLKLKKLGDLDRLMAGLQRIRARGLEPVLGDGTATEIACWLEACAGAAAIRNAGEMNGFLKLARPLLRQRLPFADGAIQLAPGWRPEIDPETLDACTTARERYAIPSGARAGAQH